MKILKIQELCLVESRGIYDFKKSFSADYYEFIGEYVLVGNKLKYYAYSKLMPTAKKLKISVIKKLR